MKIRHLIVLLAFIFSKSVFSHKHTGNTPVFKVNKGQWLGSTQYQVGIKGGVINIGAHGLQFNLYSLADIARISEDRHHATDLLSFNRRNDLVNCHAYAVDFLNANPNVIFEGVDRTEGVYNYFIGKDSSKWASEVSGYEEVYGSNIYSNIDLKLYSSDEDFKYDFIIKPNGSVNEIALTYNGVNGLELINGELIIQHSFDKVIEAKPYAYQLIRGKKKEIEVDYVLEDNTLRFSVGDYNKNKDLIIDPVVLASTYSGSTEEIYGHTGTFDDNENIYSGGAAFAPGGSPTTLGAYQVSYQGSREIVINKYNPEGNGLIYCTYIGGGDDDYPHSLYNYDGKLYVLGSTASSDYPTSSTAFDRTYNGNTDIVVTVLNSTGTNIIGSTYVGGSHIDGQNYIQENYGDVFRGEIIVDNDGYCYVSSMSSSNDFPVSNNAYQTTIGGDQDGVCFKMSSTLSSIDFATYIGGSGHDAAYGVVNSNGKIYVTGSINTNVFSASSGAYSNNNGGDDAYIIALNANATAIDYATYYGSTANDRSFFIEKDIDGNIYILGQTDGLINATTGNYNGGVGTFVAKFDETLSNHELSSSTGKLAPIAFLVDDCGFIYVSGHGGTLSLTGFEVTLDAVQSTAAGFYLMALNPDATSLNYASYYGSATSHVDGGTSRFDKKGVVYQATCTDLGFPVLSDAFSTTSNSGTYDVTVFKMAFEVNNVVADFILLEDDGPCSSNTVMPENRSTGKSYYWDFGDGVTSTEKHPHHVYTRKGSFDIKLVVSDNSNSCILPDSVTKTVDVYKIGGEQSIFVPNAFTPDNDGKNDSFGPISSGTIEGYKFQIFNRWGDLIYETTSLEDKWDGKQKGGKVETEVFVYSLRYKDECSNKKIFKKGHVTVIR